MGGKTDLETLNLNLSGAYRLNNHFSFGLGLNAIYAKAKLERYAGDLPQQIVAGSGVEFLHHWLRNIRQIHRLRA